MRLKIKLIDGFTLFEFLSVLSIIGFLTIIGSVQLIQVMNDQAVRSVRDLFSHVVHFARAEGIYTQQFVTICQSFDLHVCGGDWSNGWIIFFDVDGSGLREVYQERLINTASGDASVVMNGNNENPIMLNSSGKHLGDSQYFNICLKSFKSQLAPQRIRLAASGRIFNPVSANEGKYYDA